MYEQTGQYYALFGPQAVTATAEERFFRHWSEGRARALDLGAGLCGPAMMLSRLGLDVLALEPSPLLAALALDRLARAADVERRVTLVHETPERFAEPFEADLLLMRSVWMLLDDAQRDVVLGALQRHAAPGALLIMDARTAALAWADGGDVEEESTIGHMVLRRRTRYERAPDDGTRVHWTIHIERFGRLLRTVEESFFVRADTLESLEDNVRAVGFEVERAYAAYDIDTPYREGEAMIVAVARWRS